MLTAFDCDVSIVVVEKDRAATIPVRAPGGPDEIGASGLRRSRGAPARDLRGLADAMQRQIGSGVAAVVSVIDGKAAVVVSVSDDLKDKVDAVGLLRAGVAELGGKGGGGRPDFAQGGGADGTRADAALKAIQRALASQPAAAE